MRRALPTLLLLSVLPAPACVGPASPVVPDADRLRVTRELAGRKRFLKVAVNVGPFFGDSGKLFLSDQPFAEVELLEEPGGKTIPPPPAERILPPGTPLVIREVEFPGPASVQTTSWIPLRRVLLTPRYHPWVYLELAGEARPLVLVLPQGVKSFEDVQAELDRTLGTADPGSDLQALPEGQRRAVARKEVLEGMGPQAVTMAWGYPERRILDRPAAKEQWIWPGGRRKAWFEDERVVRVEGRN